ncbi:L-amino-acid oxidase-like [Haliotis rubra]|uniref:L-amino-acid oxidase-like n=1 Tax=Haliotis rubra TaxID=36100 RepID=UPI001EE53841|nr:L-amino-acid oxidase-like [Haliotis rubra]
MTLITLGILLVTAVVTASLIATSLPMQFSATILSKTVVNAEVPSDGDCLDVAVIGGGIGGAYTGWRLRDRGLSISVFEFSDRVGGRLFTAELPVAPGTYLDFGAMRFKSGAHPTLNRTATALGLNIIPFELGYGNADETIWYNRGKRMRNTDLGTTNIPYNLQQGEANDPDMLLWELFKNNVNITDTYPSLEDLFFLSYPGDTGSSEGYKTIAGGMEKVPRTLMEKFLEANTTHKLHLNHQLTRMERRQTGGYNLRFRKTQTVDGVTTPVMTGNTGLTMCARKVVLAAQKDAIQQIDFPEFKNNPEIRRTIDSVEGFPAGRIYLAYNTKWWKTGNPDITHTKSDLPNRQTYDWSTGTNNVSIIMASYHDGDFTHYWRELSQFGTPIPGSLPGVNAVTDVVKNRVEKYLSVIYNVSQSDIPETVGGAMMLWDRYPFSAAWGYFKAGFDERKVRDMIYKPSPSDHVYIVSNSWSADDLQGWAEGSLIAVDAVIQKYFIE